MSSQREVDGRAGMKSRRVEHGNSNVVLLDEERNLGAAENRPLRALYPERVDDPEISTARLVPEDVLPELVEDRAMNEIAVGFVGDDAGDTVPGESIAKERQLHRVAGAEQADAIEAVAANLGRCRVDDVDQRQLDALLESVGDHVQRVRAKQQAFRARCLEILRRRNDHLEQTVPVAAFVELHHLGKVEGVQDASGVLVAAPTRVHSFIDHPVVADHRQIGRAAEQAKRLHRSRTVSPRRSSTTKRPAAGIFTAASVFASMTASLPMISFSESRYATTAYVSFGVSVPGFLSGIARWT